MNYEILNDAFWKAMRFDFNSMITDCYDGQRLTLKDYIYKMLDNIYPSLEELDNTDAAEVINDIIKFGTEADQQLKFKNENNMSKLLHFLCEEVQ